eukprot:COSAG04_NODE_14874_length_552_cov_0.452539_1_plen_89_part_10
MLRSHQPSERLGAHGDGFAHALEQRRQLVRIQLTAPIRVDLSELRLEDEGLVELVAVDRPAAVRILSHALKSSDPCRDSNSRFTFFCQH